MRSFGRIGPGRVWSALSGFALGVFPQAGVAALVPAGLVSVVRQPRIHDRRLEGLIVAWGLVRAVQSWRTSGQPWTGLLEVALMWLLFRGLVALGAQRRLFGIGAAFGLAVAMAFTLVQAWSLLPFTLGWLEDSKVARLERIGETSRYTPVQAGNAWVYLASTIQGPGRVAFEFELRAVRPIRLGTFINEYRLPGGPTQRLLEPCQVSTEWRTCRLEVALPSRAVLNLGAGGNLTWKAGDPTLEFRPARVRVSQPPTLLERLSASNRTSGWSFNENGLGAWAAMVALLVIVTCRDWRWGAFGLAVGLLGVFLSGSRGALLALALGLIALALGRAWNRWPRALPWLVIALGMAFVVGVARTLQTDSSSLPPGLRAFDPDQASSVVSRLEVYRNAWQVFLESPIVGVGDLQSKLTVQLAQLRGTEVSTSAPIHAHNLVLQVLGESGLIGLIVLIGLWVVGLVRLVRARDAAGLALLTAVVVVNTVDYLFLYSPVQVAFWLALAGVEPRQDRLRERRIAAAHRAEAM